MMAGNLPRAGLHGKTPHQFNLGNDPCRQTFLGKRLSTPLVLASGVLGNSAAILARGP